MPGRAEGSTLTVNSVLRAAQIIQAFDGRHAGLSVRRLSSLTGIPRSTCHELCLTLVQSGLLESGGAAGYRLGNSFVTLGGRVIARVGIADAALGPAGLYLANTNTEVHVAQYVSTGIVYVLRLRNGQSLGSRNKTGQFWPLHTSACGMAVYAALPVECRKPHLANRSARELTVLDLADVSYREHRYVVSDVSQKGYRNVGAPILGGDGNVIGAIGTGDLQVRMSRERLRALGEAVARAAEATSRELRGVPALRQGA